MYSGITQGLFPVVAINHTPSLMRYCVELSEELRQGLVIGASVNIDGVCQTVVAINEKEVTFEAIQATLEITTLGELKVGSLVSVERSLKMGAEIGGHEVAGHVIGTAKIIKRQSNQDQLSLTLACPKEWISYILHKGFIVVDGSSLTVADSKSSGEFTIHLIPETLRLTKFKNKQIGDRVNIELDHRTRTIVDTVKNYLNQQQLVPAEPV